VNTLANQVGETIQRHRLLHRGERFLVAVSGGLDSMVLLRLLHDLAATQGWGLVVAHFNHQLRGRASQADEALVRRVAGQLGWPCLVGRGDVKALAKRTKLSLEMAARQLRHEFLARSARQSGIRTIALAHHVDDRLETFFLRLLRGAGCDGLAGIKRANPSPVDPRIRLVRPLFEWDKQALRAFAHERQVASREDRTNASLDFQRNRVRQQLLPLLRRDYQPALNRVLLRLMSLLGDTGDFLADQASDWLRHPSRRPFAALPVALQRAILQSQLLKLGAAADYELIERLRLRPNEPFSLSPAQSVHRNARGQVVLDQTPTAPFGRSQIEINLTPASGQADFDGMTAKWQRTISPSARRPLPIRRPGREFFDAAAIGPKIILRHWRKGDRFQPIGLLQPVKLQDWFTNRKVPRSRRHELVVATTATGEIWWVEGQRIADPFKVTPAIRTRLRWEWKRP
jgi:tRNA(Ile)-lysidine synthase